MPESHRCGEEKSPVVDAWIRYAVYSYPRLSVVNRHVSREVVVLTPRGSSPYLIPPRRHQVAITTIESAMLPEALVHSHNFWAIFRHGLIVGNPSQGSPVPAHLVTRRDNAAGPRRSTVHVLRQTAIVSAARPEHTNQAKRPALDTLAQNTVNRNRSCGISRKRFGVTYDRYVSGFLVCAHWLARKSRQSNHPESLIFKASFLPPGISHS